MAEEGSIDQLINKLAHGGALFVPMAVDEEYLPVVVDQLKQLTKSENLSILARLATALERADKLYHGEPIDPDPRTCGAFSLQLRTRGGVGEKGIVS